MTYCPRFIAPIVGLAALCLTSACNKDEKENTYDTEKRQAVATYAELAYATYDDAYLTAAAMMAKVDAFVANPTAAGLEEAKNAWKAARIPYGQTEVFRFQGGPIDNDSGPEGRINAWPLDENYIDYTQGTDGSASIIGNAALYPTITKELLDTLNERGGEKNISTGYHAIEFLLWGQDFSATGPGERSFTDYTTATNAARRKTYLQIVTQLLVDDLKSVRDAWRPGSAYRARITAGMSANEAVGLAFRGMGALSKGELAGERMTVAFEQQDQEDEHSCFSDNTHIDIRENFAGIRNVYLGRYQRVNGQVVQGYSFSDMVMAKDTAKGRAVTNQLAQTGDAINIIPAPFDQAITTQSPTIPAATAKLKTLSDKLVDAAFVFKINVNTELE